MKIKSKLKHPAPMLDILVAGPDKRKMDLEYMLDLEDEVGIFNFGRLVVNYDVNENNPVLVRLPGK